VRTIAAAEYWIRQKHLRPTTFEDMKKSPLLRANFDYFKGYRLFCGSVGPPSHAVRVNRLGLP
jgi:hypothetical protein